jgi:hypothetical protein
MAFALVVKTSIYITRWPAWPGKLHTLPVHNLRFVVGHDNIRAYLFNKTLHAREYLTGVLAAVADAGQSKHGDLPAVLLIYLGNHYLELVAYARHQRLDDLAFFF